MAEPTSYIVLRAASAAAGDQATAGWIDVATVDATSSTAAIRHMAKKNDVSSGTYVAVPARSWKPVKVAAVQTTVLKLEDVT